MKHAKVIDYYQIFLEFEKTKAKRRLKELRRKKLKEIYEK
jgi:hypothetical protein